MYRLLKFSRGDLMSCFEYKTENDEKREEKGREEDRLRANWSNMEADTR